MCKVCCLLWPPLCTMKIHYIVYSEKRKCFCDCPLCRFTKLVSVSRTERCTGSAYWRVLQNPANHSWSDAHRHIHMVGSKNGYSVLYNTCLPKQPHFNTVEHAVFHETTTLNPWPLHLNMSNSQIWGLPNSNPPPLLHLSNLDGNHNTLANTGAKFLMWILLLYICFLKGTHKNGWSCINFYFIL